MLFHTAFNGPMATGMRHSTRLKKTPIRGRVEMIGQPQKARGRLYQVRDRTWASEQRLAHRFREESLPELPPRVRWFLTTAWPESAR